MKFLNIVLVLVISILLAFSALAVIEIHWNLLIMKFSFSPIGIETYLTSLGKYKYLFIGTISTCSAYFGLLRLKVTYDSNNEKLKQERFNEWKTIFQIRSSEILKKDPVMIRELTIIRQHVFNSLFELDFKVTDKVRLNIVFDKHFKNYVSLFEYQNNEYTKIGGVYPDDKYSFSFDSFYYIFNGMLETWYNNFYLDLKDLYLDNLPKDRTIDENTFKAEANRMFVRYDEL